MDRLAIIQEQKIVKTTSHFQVEGNKIYEKYGYNTRAKNRRNNG